MALAERVQGEERLQADPRAEEVVATAAPRREVRARAWPLGAVRTRILLAIIFVAFVKQLFFVVAIPPFQGHDEVAHFGYIWTIEEYDRLPTLNDNLPIVLEGYADFTLDWPALYTANHPPLYYLLARPIYALAGEDPLAKLYALRLFSIPFFLLTVWLAYALAVTLFPRDDFLALTVPAFVAFQPQIGFEGAILNNDMLSIFFGALILYLCAGALRGGLSVWRALALGLALGLGLLTKATITVFLPVVAATALWCWWPRPWRRALRPHYWLGRLPAAVELAVPAALLPAPWYFFLYRTYGDFSAFDAIQELQQGWNRPVGTFGEILRSGGFHLMRIHESWGYFGWRNVPLTPGDLAVVYAFLILCGVGLLVGAGRFLWWLREAPRPRWAALDPVQPVGVGLLVAASLLLYGAMMYFGTFFALTQARYFFPAVTAMAVILMLGLRALVPPRFSGPAAALAIGAFAGFNLFLLTQLLIPYTVLYGGRV